ncbi:hypothetical protein SDRG_08310 [Saprolegnia diclina VS20]|uniref:Uncharacterized protein n=1 Tax=Saprolegnia diclina (strain VS20) TaxID=1156394 RepID=T0QH81_SAPDV|nr:hypothetical protein SDRG_08310 [Saprolegnia diclina VS20]EQC34101.1 hypothetical protein SDRG_08310 [Saprolegnia diclina VS20]|eukprot:XP_008612413.1 hypothetical protein SDRG_08310 [Saprolegnia diclina VS20]
MHLLQPPSLLSLPTDVRGHIYGFLLSARLGFRPSASSSTNPLAWVGTCRAMYDDVQAMELTELAMDFATTQAFLDTMSRLPQRLMRQLKNVRMIGYLLPLNPDTQAFAHPADAINFFPALQLDSMVVEDYFHSPKSASDDYLSHEMTRHQVSYLLATDGWKSLQYVSYSTGFLSLAGASQVGMWDKFLKDMYGQDASVTVYVAKEAHAAPDAYRLLRNDPARVLDDLTDFEHWAPEMAQKAPSRPREVRLIAKRGATKPLVQTCKTLDIASDAFQQQYLWATTIADDARSAY